MGKIFKVDAQGDTLYINAEDQADASKQLAEKIGNIPASMLSWSEVAELPENEEFL